MSPQKKSQTEVLLNWIFLSVSGFFIALTILQFAPGLVFALTGGGLAGRLVEGMIIGCSIGVIQLMALPPPLPRNVTWVLTSGIAWAIGWGYGWQTANYFPGQLTLTFAVVGGTSGILTGFLQWSILRRFMPQAGWWVIGCTLGWGLGLALGSFIRSAIGWAASGAIAGLVTGLVLIWLLRIKPQPQ